MKKFRELRMTVLCIILVIIFTAIAVISVINGDKLRFIGSLLLDVIALILLFARYKMIMYTDMMMIYEWKVLAMLPTIIEYKDIENIEKKSTHCVLIEHIQQGKIHHSKIYLFNSDDFLEFYQSLRYK